MKKVVYLSSLLAFCFSLCSVAAFAIPTSPVHIIGNPISDTVCSGTRDTFTASAIDTAGGITTTVSYLWQVSTDGGTSWTYASDTTIYSGDSTGTLTVSTNVLMNGYEYRCIASDSNGTATSGTAKLTVIGVAPGTISGPTIVCKSSSITLHDTVSGGVWSSTNTGIASIGSSSGVLTGLMRGVDTVKYTDSNMCGMGVTTVLIRVDSAVAALPISGPTATCVGHDITLTNPNNTAGTWIWSTSNGNAAVSSAGIVSGIAHGMDTVYYAFTNACMTVTSSYEVNIDTVLAHGTISGADTLCAGSWTHLTESVTGGLWFSSSSALAVVDASGNVTGVAQGMVTISYYLSNACGASIATHSMVIISSAIPIAGRDSVGVGLTRTLYDSVVGGIWTTTDTSIATVDSFSGVVTGIAVGTATITYSVTNFCGTSSATVVMNVGNRPDPGTISGPTSVCIGSTKTLTESVPGGVWSSTVDSIATVGSTSGVVYGAGVDSGTASTVVNIGYTISTGFGDTTIYYAVTVLHTPIIAITNEQVTYSLGTNYLFDGMPHGGTWTHTASTIASFIGISDSVVSGVDYGTVLSYVMLSAGTDVLHYKVTNACGSADSSFTIQIVGVGIKNIANPGFTMNIYPNPNQGQFTMKVSGNNNELATVTITNIVGEKVKEVTIPTNTLADIKIDQPEGVYMVTAETTSGAKYTARISIAK